MEMNYKLEDLSDEELFRIQNKAYELIKERNLKKGDLEEARRRNNRLYPPVRAFYDAPFLDMHNRMKEALHYLGRLPEAYVRPPLMKLTNDEIQKIKRCMDDAGLSHNTVYQKVA